MTVNGINNQSFYEKIKNTNTQKGQKNHFQDRLSDLMSDNRGTWEGDEIKDSRGTDTSSDIHRSSHGISSKIAISYDTGRVSASAVMECAAKNISYEESDHVKVCVVEGYTFKAQVDITGHKVYLEQKNEDGTVKAYEVNPLKLDRNTEDPLEQMALESWEMARKALAGDFFTEVSQDDLLIKTGLKPVQDETASDKSTIDNLMGMSLQEAMQSFYVYVVDRIKNGDPKIPIGGSEMSVKEWDKLLEKVDDNLEDAKEELAERIRKQREEQGESVSDTENYGEKPSMETWALTDQRYTDEETGISWYAGEGRSPYMIGEDAERFQKLCEENKEEPSEKFAEMTRNRLES